MNKNLEREIEILNDLLEQDRFYLKDIKNKYYSGILIIISIFTTIIIGGINPLTLLLLIFLTLWTIFYLKRLQKLQYYYQKEKSTRKRKYSKLGVDYNRLGNEVGGEIK